MHDACSLRVPQAHDQIEIQIQIPNHETSHNDHSSINIHNNNNNNIIANSNDLGNENPDEQIKVLEPLIAVASLSGKERERAHSRNVLVCPFTTQQLGIVEWFWSCNKLKRA